MSQRHAPDAVAVVFGTAFAGSTVAWLLWVTGHLHSGGWWIGPIVLIAAGVAGLLAALRPHRSQRPELPGDPTSP